LRGIAATNFHVFPLTHNPGKSRTTIQGCLYKATPPFGSFRTRKDALAEFRKQLEVIDDILDGSGKYLCGDEVSLGDATLFPTMIFAKHMLPKFGVPEEDALPSKINKWYEGVIESDDDFKKVYHEVMGALLKWDDNKRWDNILLAGVRDDEPATIFDKIVAGDIPAAIVKDTDKVLAFKDINPTAPAHVLVIPKDRSGLSSLRKATPDHVEILGLLLVAAGEIANDKSLGFGDGARIVINDGPDGGQEISHLHVHVLGGRQLTWPPG
jgi:diadenosine tetraphosphate (Ap4A) HIT family hydrolase